MAKIFDLHWKKFVTPLICVKKFYILYLQFLLWDLRRSYPQKRGSKQCNLELHSTIFKRISGIFCYYCPNNLYNLEIFGFAKSTVINTVKKYAKLENMESRPRSGRPRKINQRDMRHLVRILREYPSKTSTELAKTINLTKNDTISSSSIRKNLFKIGLKSYAARKKPFITEKMKLKRLN